MISLFSVSTSVLFSKYVLVIPSSYYYIQHVHQLLDDECGVSRTYNTKSSRLKLYSLLGCIVILVPSLITDILSSVVFSTIAVFHHILCFV